MHSLNKRQVECFVIRAQRTPFFIELIRSRAAVLMGLNWPVECAITQTLPPDQISQSAMLIEWRNGY
jgi:hypothetical protein